jgi:hypothetical protein
VIAGDLVFLRHWWGIGGAFVIAAAPVGGTLAVSPSRRLAVALTKIHCPECGAGLKSPTAFVVGQTVVCPKCKNRFQVEEPREDPPARPGPGKKPIRAAAADDEEDERPRKKARAAADDEDEDRPRKKVRADDDEEDERPRRKARAAADDEDEEEEERPRKKKKKRRRDDDEDAKSNTAFYVRLGVLLAILVVLAILFVTLGPGGLNKQ